MKTEKYNNQTWELDIQEDFRTLYLVCLTLIETHPNLDKDTKHFLECILKRK